MSPDHLKCGSVSHLELFVQQIGRKTNEWSSFVISLSFLSCSRLIIRSEHFNSQPLAECGIRVTHQFRSVLGPREVADLAARVDGLHGLAGERVPEAYAPVGRPATARQQTMVVRRPRDGLHGGQMVRVRLNRLKRQTKPIDQIVRIVALTSRNKAFSNLFGINQLV